jgi:UDP-N-acetylmuramoyl-L-alanyl-D-glutamate--2,6-diaminopimelate ligase
MILRELLKDCSLIEPVWDDNQLNNIDIAGIAYDSRAVKQGYLFVALMGEKTDGHNFVTDAINKGAVAVVSERETSATSPSGDCVPGARPLYIRVANSRRALACIANNFHERPSEALKLIGVTGTNGKTTTTHILKSILEKNGHAVGLIGTIKYMIRDRSYPAVHTTPESPEFQGLLRKMLSSGCTHVISEVSSHALAQHRVDGAVFRSAVFTNLTRDHLDFHKTMQAYFEAKKRLFADLLDEHGFAIINIDDPYGNGLYSELLPVRWMNSGPDIITYGLQPGVDLRAHDISNSSRGLRFRVSLHDRILDISSPLIGLINVYNILAAIGAAVSLQVPDAAIIEGIRNPDTIAGRFEKVDAGQDFLCVVDYAHTEDALERLIMTARELLEQSASQENSKQTEKRKKKKNGLVAEWAGPSPRIITVFGCGGDRDKGKRPAMGAVATKYSDFAVITSDNPRSEDPLDIIRDIEAGAAQENYLTEPDRRKAIRKAVDMAQDGDIILIAGKGHEDYQEIQGVRYPFSDRDILREAIRNKAKIRNEKCKVHS